MFVLIASAVYSIVWAAVVAVVEAVAAAIVVAAAVAGGGGGGEDGVDVADETVAVADAVLNSVHNELMTLKSCF